MLVVCADMCTLYLSVICTASIYTMLVVCAVRIYEASYLKVYTLYLSVICTASTANICQFFTKVLVYQRQNILWTNVPYKGMIYFFYTLFFFIILLFLYHIQHRHIHYIYYTVLQHDNILYKIFQFYDMFFQ